MGSYEKNILNCKFFMKYEKSCKAADTGRINATHKFSNVRIQSTFKFGFIGGLLSCGRGGACSSRNLQKPKITIDFYVAGGASPSPTA